jgi:hypothetical protein
MDKVELQKLRDHANKHSAGRDGDFTYFTGPEVLALLDHIDALEGQNKLLLDSLRTAIEWNWLDEDVPSEIVDKCEAAIASAVEGK